MGFNAVLPQLDRVKGIALDILFPKHCVGCGKEGEFLCIACTRSLIRVLSPLCSKCGRPQASGILCPDCVSWNSNIDGIRSPFRFDGVMREAVHQLKYRNLRAISFILSQFLFEFVAANPLPGDVIVPVPLHRKRLRERGYNQSELLAEGLSKLTGIPIDTKCLYRQRQTIPQVRTATAEERHANIRGAFQSANRDLEGKKVILIDDVSTSGATLDACAGALKEGGAISVWGLVLAREI